MAKPNLSERQLVAKIETQLRRSHGWDADKVESDRKNALDYYFQRPRGDEVAGASKVVSGDLSAMVEANLAQMMDAFSGDEIAEFQAYGENDEDQAALESCAVQYMVMSRNNGYLQFLQAIKDALLLRNGVIKVWVEDKKSVIRRKFLNVEPEAVANIFEVPPNVDVEPGEYNPQEKTLNVKFTIHRRTFKCEAVPIENFLYTAEWDSQSVRDIPFCAERHVSPRSDLIEMGFDKAKVNALRPWNNVQKTASLARSPRSQTDFRESLDKSGDLIEWYECHCLMDTDGDGVSERRTISVSNGTLLDDVPSTIVPYATGSAIVNPHRFLGISLYDKLRQVQDVSTGLERGLLDNVTASNKPRVAYLDGLVNVEDLDNGRPNGSVRVRKTVGEVSRAVSAIIIPDMSQGILANLEHQRSLRSEMGGAALDLATGQMQLNERLGSQGLDRAYSVMEQLAALMTRTVAATLIREVFLIAHAMLREHFDEPLPFKQGARWMTAVPSEWPDRTELTVKVGMSPGERQRRAMALERVGKFQESMAAQGMDEVLVDLERFYRLAMDWCRSQDIPNPEQYFVDPRSEQSLRARKIKSDAATRDAAAQQAFLQQAVQLEQLRTAFDKYRQDTDLQFKYFAETLRAEIEEAKIVGSATTELVKAGIAPKGGMNGKGNGANANRSAIGEATESKSVAPKSSRKAKA